jgi:hypothetical protein
MPAGQFNAVLHHVRKLVVAHGTQDLTDSQLLHRFSAHQEEEAFAALVKRHGRLVWGICRRELGHEQDAENAFQATFVVLAHHAGSIRKRASNRPGSDGWPTWANAGAWLSPRLTGSR